MFTVSLNLTKMLAVYQRVYTKKDEAAHGKPS